MFLPPFSHFPSDAELAAIEPEHAIAVIAAIAAVLCSDAGAGDPQVAVGMRTPHLWVARPGMDGVALFGARLLSLFKQWRPVPGQRVDCIGCLSLHAEMLSNHP
jgi:hypothetical protein